LSSPQISTGALAAAAAGAAALAGAALTAAPTAAPTASGLACVVLLAMKLSTSSRSTRPSRPVPRIKLKSMFFSFVIARTAGVANGLFRNAFTSSARSTLEFDEEWTAFAAADGAGDAAVAEGAA
jgi:hypothetical protein